MRCNKCNNDRFHSRYDKKTKERLFYICDRCREKIAVGQKEYKKKKKGKNKEPIPEVIDLDNFNTGD